MLPNVKPIKPHTQVFIKVSPDAPAKSNDKEKATNKSKSTKKTVMLSISLRLKSLVNSHKSRRTTTKVHSK
jgi:hypothetical protein